MSDAYDDGHPKIMTPAQRDGLRKFADSYARYIATVDEQDEFNSLAEYVDACIETQRKRLTLALAEQRNAVIEECAKVADGLDSTLRPHAVAQRIRALSAQKDARQQALDAMADNARELGLDYTPEEQ